MPCSWVGEWVGSLKLAVVRAQDDPYKVDVDYLRTCR